MEVVDATKAGIGLDGAGIVRSVGSGIKDVRSGDRVLMFEHGCFSTRVAISAKACEKSPTNLALRRLQRCLVSSAPSFIRCLPSGGLKGTR